MHEFELLWALIISLLVFHQVQAQTGNGVSLTTDGGGSLVGSFCPGTRRLTCVGVDLTLLQWKHNGNQEILTFDTDDHDQVGLPITIGEPGFISAELEAISQNINPNFANFTSSLIVDLAGLRDGGVYRISCGDLGSESSLDVNLSDLPEPNITAITAVYEEGALASLELTWMKVATVCPLSVFYIITLNDNSTVANVTHTSCDELCFVDISEFNSGRNNLKITAFNALTGNETTTTYPRDINTENSGIDSSVVVNGSELVGVCKSFYENIATCTIRYSDDSVLLESIVIGNLTAAVNYTFIVPGVMPCTQYYFEFSVELDHQFTIVERLNVFFPGNQVLMPAEWVLVVLFILMVLLTIITTVALVFCAVKNRNITKQMLFADVIILLVVLSFSSAFFVAWISLASIGTCRVLHITTTRIILLLICLISLACGLLIKLLFICCYPGTEYRGEYKVMPKAASSTARLDPGIQGIPLYNPTPDEHRRIGSQEASNEVAFNQSTNDSSTEKISLWSVLMNMLHTTKQKEGSREDPSEGSREPREESSIDKAEPNPISAEQTDSEGKVTKSKTPDKVIKMDDNSEDQSKQVGKKNSFMSTLIKVFASVGETAH